MSEHSDGRERCVPTFEQMVPQRYRCLFGGAALVDQDPDRYDALIYAIVSEHAPKNCHDWFLVSEAVNKQCEVELLRRMKSSVISQARLQNARQILEQRTGSAEWRSFRMAELRELILDTNLRTGLNLRQPAQPRGIYQAFFQAGVEMQEIEAAVVRDTLAAAMLLERAQTTGERRLAQLMREIFADERSGTIEHDQQPIVGGELPSEHSASDASRQVGTPASPMDSVVPPSNAGKGTSRLGKTPAACPQISGGGSGGDLPASEAITVRVRPRPSRP